MSLYKKINMPESPIDSSSQQNYQNLKSLFKKYFKVTDKEAELYKNLGVKKFQKYWINGGSYWSRRIKELSWLNFPKKSKLEKLIGLVETTKKVEMTHLILATGFIPIIASYLSNHDYIRAASLSMLELLGNIYPIMSQRELRNRTEKILKNYSQD
jgi:hypothetical protein